MKKILLPIAILALITTSCMSDDKEHVENQHETSKNTTISPEMEKEIVPRKPWKDSLAAFEIFDYVQLLDTHILRNGNTEKMFLAKPKYTRCQDKGWKSAFQVELKDNLIAYQTTNADEEYKVMGYGYEPEYHEKKSEDTITVVKLWKENAQSNLIFTASNTEVAGFDNYLIDLKIIRHDSTGMNDVTEELLPKVAFTDFLGVPIDSTDLSIPKFVPLTYRIDYYNKDILMIQYNRYFVDIDKKYGNKYNWMDDYDIPGKWSVDPESWMPTLYFKLENGKFVRTDAPKRN